MLRLSGIALTRSWVLALILPLVGIGVASAWQNRQRDFANRSEREHRAALEQRCANTLLVPSVSEFDFGTLARGGRQRASFWLHNTGKTTVELARITASCDCLHVTVAKNSVSPGERIQATAEVDCSDDPSYVGRLLLEASADVLGQAVPAFAISVNVTVE